MPFIANIIQAFLYIHHSRFNHKLI